MPKSTKLQAVTDKPAVKMKPPNAGKGRPKGSKNIVGKTLKEAILSAFTKVGGEEYLVQQAKENPVAFLGLIAKIMPTQLTGEGGAPLLPPSINFVRAPDLTK